MRRPGTLLLCLLLLVGAACGDDGGNDGQQADEAPQASGTRDAEAPGDAPGACALATGAEVSSALGVELVDGIPLGGPDVCAYRTPEDSSGLNLYVNSGPDAGSVFEENRSSGTTESVDVGDDAFFEDRDGAADVNAMVGDTLVRLELFYDEAAPRDRLVELAGLVVERLAAQ